MVCIFCVHRKIESNVLIGQNKRGRFYCLGAQKGSLVIIACEASIPVS